MSIDCYQYVTYALYSILSFPAHRTTHRNENDLPIIQCARVAYWNATPLTS